MTKRSSSKQLPDPELTRQLDAATREQRSLQVVFFLKSAAQATRSRAPAPQETKDTVRDVIARVEAETGERVEDFNVFPSLGSFVIQASPRVVEAVLAQAEVASAKANRRSES